MRQWRSLSGEWQFDFDPEGTYTITPLRLHSAIPVPSAWQAIFPESQHYSGYAWYRREVDLEPDWLGGELLLSFGAVDYWCQVFINGELAGEHEGGYTPFTIRAAKYMRAGRNELVVRVYDVAQESIVIPRWGRSASTNGTGPSKPPFDPNDIPHGKQEWYVNVGGIWQDVTLTAVPATWIDDVRVTPDIGAGQAHIRVELGGEAPVQSGGALRIGLRSASEPPGSEVAEATLLLVAGQAVYEADLAVEQLHMWSMEDPYLYVADVSLSLMEAERDADQIAVRFGFREIAAKDGQLLLNGEPIFLLAALDQDIYPQTIYTVPSEEYLRDEFRKARELGLNCLRCHIKPPDPLYLNLADEMGLLVWAEIPSWRTFYIKGTLEESQLNLGEMIKLRAEQTLEEMIKRDYNHPSIIIWTLVNEDWGTTLPLSASDRDWVAQLYRHCKRLDPTRLVVDNSACPHPWGPNVHVHSDIDDFHIYANIPEQAQSFERMIEQFNLRPLWTYSSHGDATRTGHEPLILSEFGNWGMAELGRLHESAGTPDGKDPAWFTIGPWWNSWEGEAGWPKGVEERFRRLGLEEIWPTYDDFARATQWHQFAALKIEIEAMRRQPSLAGYVITELSDIYWETNGLLDFYRNPKAYHNLFASINSPDMIIPHTHVYAHWNDAPASARLHVAHYSSADWAGARLKWRVDGQDAGERELPFLARGDVRSLARQSWDLPKLGQARTVPVEFLVEGRDGSSLAANRLDLFVTPPEWRRKASDISLAAIVSEGAERAGMIESLARPPEGIDWVQPDPMGMEGTGERDTTGTATHLTHDLQRNIRRLGYHATRRITPDTRIVVATYPDAATLKWVREGGDMLALVNGPNPFFWVQGRSGPYSGSWLTSFSWIRPWAHKRLATASNPLGMPFSRIMPMRTILGLPLEDRSVQGDFLSGMISGWVGHPAVHTVQFRYGKGRVIMTTFALEQALASDPMAAAMFHDLIDHLLSEACCPTLQANW